MFASLGAALGGGSAVAGGLAAASTAATIGTSIDQATRKEKDPGSKIVAPPSVGEAQKEVVAQKRRARRGLTYRDTILSRAMETTAGPTSGGKQLLGQ